MPYQVLPRIARPAPRPVQRPGGTVAPARKPTRIVVADYPQLVVAYSAHDDLICLLCPPGGDPRTALAAARLVLPDEVYQELAGYLGVASSWHADQEATG